jgi:hypothetical protein
VLSLTLLPGLLVVYYVLVWLCVGRDPKPGTIVPRYEPPEGLSPAAVRYVLISGTDGKSLAAVLADLALRKQISIVPESGRYSVLFLKGAPGQEELPPEEQKVLELLSAYGTKVTVDPADSERNSMLITAIQGSLSSRLSGVYFTGNFGYIAAAVAVTFLWSLLMAATHSKRDGVTFLTFWFLSFTLILGAIVVVRVIPALKDAISGRLSAKNTFFSILGLLFLAMPALVLYKIAEGSSNEFAAMLAAVVLIHLVFGPLMKAPTRKGRETLDWIEGYRQFLASVEQDRLERLNDPQSAPALLNAALPYAIALDLEQAWGDHLSGAFFAATVSKGG